MGCGRMGLLGRGFGFRWGRVEGGRVICTVVSGAVGLWIFLFFFHDPGQCGDDEVTMYFS